MAILFGRNQLPVVLSFFVCGSILGIAFDILKIKRMLFGSNFLFTFFDDSFFCVVSGMMIVVNAYALNDGNMKWYEIPLTVAGFSLWHCTLSPPFMRCVNAVLHALGLATMPIRRAIKRLLHAVSMAKTAIYFSAVTCVHRRRLCGFRP